MARTGAAGGWLLMLLGLSFLGAGGYVGYLTVTTLTDWHAAKKWVEAPATIQRLELAQHRGKKGHVSYRVLCEYAYPFGGQTYQGDRVGLSSGSDNIGDWHVRTHSRLEADYRDDEATTCYVDPADPSRAVLDRELRPELVAFLLVFCAVFPTAGIGMFLGGLGTINSGAGRSLRATCPDRPWMWHRHWAAGRIPAGTKLKVVCLSAMAITWNAVSAPVVMIVTPEAIVAQGRTWAYALLAYPVIGVVIIGWAVYALMRHLKFGRSYLRLQTLPGVIGGQFRGELILAGDLTGLEAVDVSLLCIHSVTTGSGKHRHTTRTTVWEEKKTCSARRTFEGLDASVPVEYDIPPNAMPTGASGPNSQIDWKLKAAAEVPGVDLKLEFEVPVFHVDTTASPPPVDAFQESG